jgi:dCMP deaminase
MYDKIHLRPRFTVDQLLPQTIATGVFPEHVDSWDEYFLWIAEAVAIKSKDPRCSVGAVIVSSDNIVLSTGFNGLARRIYDDEKLLADAEEKLKVICHAEANAIYNAARMGVALEGASIFVTKFPCLACCNAIIQAGISGSTRTTNVSGTTTRSTQTTDINELF